MQVCGISSANALEIPQPYTKPSIWQSQQCIHTIFIVMVPYIHKLSRGEFLQLPRLAVTKLSQKVCWRFTLLGHRDVMLLLVCGKCASRLRRDTRSRISTCKNTAIYDNVIRWSALVVRARRRVDDIPMVCTAVAVVGVTRRLLKRLYCSERGREMSLYLRACARQPAWWSTGGRCARATGRKSIPHSLVCA